MNEPLRHTAIVSLADGRDYWEEFVHAALLHPGRTVMSAEPLSFASSATSQRVAHALSDLPLRVVVTTRPVSELVLSAYGEWAKSLRLPGPDIVARGVLGSLLAKGHASRFSWMLVSRIREVWGPSATDGWHEVVLTDTPGEEFLRSFWRALGIVDLAPPQMPRQNRSLPYGALVAWQEHLRRQTHYDHRVDGGTITEVARFNDANVSAPRSRLAWSANMASLIDATFPLSGSAGQDGDRAREQLQARIDSGAPLIDSKPTLAAHPRAAEVHYWERVIARKHRVVRARIEVARRFGVRRRHHPDWDAFRQDRPVHQAEFFCESDA
jgi:hypothetical protein